MKSFLLVALLFCFGQSYGQLTTCLEKNKVGINYNNTSVVKPKYDSVLIFDNNIATAYKKNKVFYINTIGKKIYKGDTSHVDPFQSGIGVIKLKKNYYGLINKRGVVFLSQERNKPERIGNLVYVNGSNNKGSLYFNGVELEGDFKNLTEIYNWVSFENSYYIIRTEKKLFHKKTTHKDYSQKTSLYNKLTGDRVIYNLDTLIEFKDFVYLKEKYKNQGAIYYGEGKVLVDSISKFEFYNDSIILYKKKHNTVLFNINSEKIIIDGQYEQITTKGQYLYCELGSLSSFTQVSIHDLNGLLLNEKVNYYGDLDSNRIYLMENDSFYIATMEGNRLSENYFGFGEAYNGFITVYNRYSYSYINNSSYEKIPINIPLISVKKRPATNILQVFGNMIQDFSVLIGGKGSNVTHALKQFKFQNGMAVVPVNYFNQNYDSIYTEFSNDIKFNYLKADGTLLNSIKYDNCLPFIKDTTWVEYKNRYYPINKKGKKVTNLKFDDVEVLENGYFIVGNFPNSGIVSPDFKQIVSCKYDEIILNDGKFYARKNIFDEELILLDVE